MKNLIKDVFLNKIVFNITISFILGLLFINGFAGIAVTKNRADYTHELITSLICFTLFLLIETISFRKQNIGVRIISVAASLFIILQYYPTIQRLLAQ